MSLVVEKEKKHEVKVVPATYSTNGSVPPQQYPYAGEPYPYGWRYVEQMDENYKLKWVRVPLTLEDNLHPEEEDRRVMNSDHAIVSQYIVNIFKKQIGDISNAYVFVDLRTDLNLPGIKPGRPDIAVTFNVQQEKQKWGTFYTAEEGTSPSLIVEVTSPSTRHQDFGEKKDEYEQAEIPYYLIIDNIYHDDPSGKGWVERRLFGYRFANGQYVEMTPDSEGQLWFPPVQLWVGIEGDKICFYDNDGHLMRDYTELDEAYVGSQVQLTEERDARLNAEEEAKAIEKERQKAEDRVKAEADARQEAEDKAKVEAEARQKAENRAKAEAEARQQAEEELERLRAILAQQNL